MTPYSRPLAVLGVLALLAAACGTAGARDATPSADASGTSPSAAAASVHASPDETPPGEATPVPNLQEGVVSEEGRFVGSLSSDPAVPPINSVHQWILHIATPAGTPVVGATITVGGDMPAHGHGMPTQPEVTADLGGGDYRVEGMAFQMGGYWIIDVTVTAGGETDLIRFGLQLGE
jgi:YtkA-like